MVFSRLVVGLASWRRPTAAATIVPASGRADQLDADMAMSSGRDRRRICGGRASSRSWGSHPYPQQVEDHPNL
jgi:hypothetical protein